MVNKTHFTPNSTKNGEKKTIGGRQAGRQAGFQTNFPRVHCAALSGDV